MPLPDSKSEHLNEVEAALLDAELFVKYKAPEKAVAAADRLGSRARALAALQRGKVFLNGDEATSAV